MTLQDKLICTHYLHYGQYDSLQPRFCVPHCCYTAATCMCQQRGASITIPLARLLGGVTSLMMAKLRLMLPLLTPPMMRATTNTVKLCETAHTAYDSAIPTCRNKSNIL